MVGLRPPAADPAVERGQALGVLTGLVVDVGAGVHRVAGRRLDASEIVRIGGSISAVALMTERCVDSILAIREGRSPGDEFLLNPEVLR